MAEVAQSKNAQQGRSQKVLTPVLRISLLVGVAIHLLGFLVFRVVSVPLPLREQAGAFVQFVPSQTLTAGGELEEQAMLFDSAPLFIPTRWNAAQEVYQIGSGRLNGRFPEFDPEIDLVASLEPGKLPLAENAIVEKPIDLLASQYWHFFEDFGASHEPLIPFRDPRPVATVTALGGESVELSPEFDGLDFPELLEPVVYFWSIAPSGRELGAPTLVSASGDDAFDRAVRAWLTSPSILPQLPVGYLEITVYP